MTREANHFFDKKRWDECESFRSAWKKAYPNLKHSVRSLSGWTKELLGYPTSTWFAGGDQ